MIFEISSICRRRNYSFCVFPYVLFFLFFLCNSTCTIDISRWIFIILSILLCPYYLCCNSSYLVVVNSKNKKKEKRARLNEIMKYELFLYTYSIKISSYHICLLSGDPFFYLFFYFILGEEHTNNTHAHNIMSTYTHKKTYTNWYWTNNNKFIATIFKVISIKTKIILSSHKKLGREMLKRERVILQIAVKLQFCKKKIEDLA